LISRNPTWRNPLSIRPQEAETERPRSIALGQRYVALLIAAFALLATFYTTCILTAVLPFNSGSWVVGEEVAMRGWLAYTLSAAVHFAASVGLWRQWRWARWLAVLLLAIGLLPAVPGISSAVMDLRIAGIALWGTLIVVRTSALYMLMSPD
jgi:hypothetical protein